MKLVKNRIFLLSVGIFLAFTSFGISQLVNELIPSPKNSHEANFKLNWAANVEEDLAYYKVYRSLTSAPDTSEVLLTTTTLTNYLDANLPAGVTFKYEISAVDTSGNESGRSNPATETAIDMKNPTKPEGLQILAVE